MGRPSLSSPSVRPVRTNPVKKAVSIAISYSNLATTNPNLCLGHVYEDAERVIKLLTDTLGYRKENITVLQDRAGPQYRPPTRENILAAMRDLVANVMPGDHLVFHISGHGSQVVCPVPGQEKDGRDEVFWPMDVHLQSSGDAENPIAGNFIRDDEIKDILVKGFCPKAKLVLIADCCHSGTIADLPHAHSDHWHVPRKKGLRIDDQKFDDKAVDALSAVSAPGSLQIATKSANVVCWSACKDEQVTYNPWNRGGIFVELLTEFIKSNLSQTHGELLHRVSSAMEQIICKLAELAELNKTDVNEIVAPRPLLSSLCFQAQIYDVPISEIFGDPEA